MRMAAIQMRHIPCPVSKRFIVEILDIVNGLREPYPVALMSID